MPIDGHRRNSCGDLVQDFAAVVPRGTLPAGTHRAGPGTCCAPRCPQMDDQLPGDRTLRPVVRSTVRQMPPASASSSEAESPGFLGKSERPSPAKEPVRADDPK